MTWIDDAGVQRVSGTDQVDAKGVRHVIDCPTCSEKWPTCTTRWLPPVEDQEEKP